MSATLGRALGDAILQFFHNRGLSTTLGLVSCDWGKRRSQEPVYPSNPRTACPRLDLYLDEELPEPWTSGQAKIAATFTAWYKRRHLIGLTPPEAHQAALVDDVEIIEKLFLPAARISQGRMTSPILTSANQSNHTLRTHLH